jgi:hypothetical protein
VQVDYTQPDAHISWPALTHELLLLLAAVVPVQHNTRPTTDAPRVVIAEAALAKAAAAAACRHQTRNHCYLAAPAILYCNLAAIAAPTAAAAAHATITCTCLRCHMLHAPDAHVSLLLGLHLPKLLLLLLLTPIYTKPWLHGCTSKHCCKHCHTVHAPDAQVSLLLGLTAAART